MKQLFVFSPKQLLTIAAIVLGCTHQAAAQDQMYAYAGPNTSSKAPEGKNEMVMKGTTFTVHQDVDASLRFLVRVHNPGLEKLTLYIKDAANNTLYKEALKSNATRFVARYNLEKLDDGEYTFEIRSGKNKLEKAVDIRTQLTVDRIASVE
ncbi:hypothetical protein ACWKWU_08700 [Chitinophaga lutea]